MQGEPAAAPSTPAVSKSRPVFVSFPCLARPRFFLGASPRRAPAPAVGKSRSVFVFLPSRARTRFFPGACSRTAPVFPGGEKARACGGHTCGGQVARLRRASRAPVCAFSQPRTHRPAVSKTRTVFVPFPASHARAPAVSKTRTVSFSFPCLARTRLFPGACPRTASVGRGPQKAFLHRSYDTGLRRASRAPCCAFSQLARTRACGDQVAHRVYAFAQPRTHAVGSGCAPAPGFCWPGPAAAPANRPRFGYLRSLYRKAMSKAREWTNFIEHLFALYHGFAAADGSAGPLHAQNGAIKEERAPCETAPRRE